MKINKTKAVLLGAIIVLFSSSIAKAQERYRISYDYKTEEIVYLKLDKSYKVVDTLDQPRFKRNRTVEIQLKNINPFAVKIKQNVQEEELTESGQGFNFSSLLGGINSFTGNNLKLNTSSLPDDDAFSSSGARGYNDAANIIDELNITLTKVSALRTTLVSNLVNPNMGKEAILKNFVQTSDDYQEIHLESTEDNFYDYLAKVEKSITDNKTKLERNVKVLSADIKTQTFSDELGPSRGDLEQKNVTLGELQDLINNLDTSTEESAEILEEIRSLITVLEASNFEQIYDYELNADQMNIELKFLQSDFSKDLAKSDEETVLKTRSIKMRSKGGFKINTSVAMTLNNFGESSNDYFIDDNGVVGADVNDYFVPNLSTMINFYPFMSENFNVGGSFGISIPITGNNSNNGINFLLGPSLFFGSKSRLALSGGLALGPVRQLTNGIEVGDQTSFGSIDNFTKSVYDLGYYFGISFSLFDIN